MLPVPVFFAMLALCCGYAWFKGGAPERAGAAIFALAALLSTAMVSGRPARFGSVELGVFAVDVAMLLALLVLALRAERFWPLWVTALQVIGTAGHTVKLADPRVFPLAYAIVLALWSYPMLILLAFGTWNHQRRLTRSGADKSWSNFSARSAKVHRAGPTG
ncbi:MAG TPA: hypothetical protein VGB62_03210 [Allosphingosinicella sp.]|jgi:hypothetical protein